MYVYLIDLFPWGFSELMKQTIEIWTQALHIQWSDVQEVKNGSPVVIYN